MKTAKELINVAKSQVGNYGMSNKFNGNRVLDWCAYFVHWCLAKIGLAKWIEQSGNYAYCPTVYTWAKKHGYVKYQAKKGDLVLYDWDKNGVPNHIGIVIDYGDGYIKSVEGNTGDPNGVHIRTREKRYVLCFVRPPYKVVKPTKKVYTGKFPKLDNHKSGNKYLYFGSTKSQVKLLQQFLNWAIGAGLKVDGEFGSLTRNAVRHFRELVGLSRGSGKFGPVTLSKAIAFRK